MMEYAENMIDYFSSREKHPLFKYLEAIFQKFPDGFIYKDANFVYKYINQGFCNIFNTDARSILDKVSIPELSSQNIELIKDINHQIAQNFETVNYIIGINLNNEEKVLNVTSYPIVHENKFCGIASIIRDTTQEEKLKEQFVSKHYQLKSLLENIPLIIYMQDRNINYITGSRHSNDFINNGYDKLTNLHLDINPFNKDDRIDNLEVMKGKKKLIKEQIISDYHKNQHYYKLYKIPITDYKDSVTGVITIANNIDAEKQLQQQKETFVATLGHDLKNPTIAQIRSIELLIKGLFGNINSEQKEILEMVLDSCKYMKGMLSVLLDTYRNYGGNVSLHFEDFLLQELVSECVAEMSYVAKDKELSICTNFSLNDKSINGDIVQLKRVIMNLLSNGIKYAYRNSCLKLSLYEEKSNIFFEFENSSPYISKSKQKSIFAQYVSYAGSFKVNGTGLGLYASNKIIKAHGGRMYVHSYKNDKNIFGFKIPVQRSNNRESYINF